MASLPEKNSARAFGDNIQADLKSRYIKRLHWMGTLRWVVVGAVSVGIVLAAELDVPLPLTLMSVTLTALILTNLWFSAVNNKLDPNTAGLSGIQKFFYFETCIDYVFLLWLIHLSGGINNLLSFCFVFHVIIASVILPSRANYMLAALATVMVAGLGAAEYSGLVAHYDLGVFESSVLGDAPYKKYFIAHYTVAFAAIMFGSAYISSELGTMLRRRDKYMAELHAALESSRDELVGANERLIEIDHTKTYFMKMAAHEIRSPVSAIISVMNSIIEGYVDDREQIINMLKLGAERAYDALKLSKDLHDLAREKSRDLDLAMYDVSGDVLEAVTSMKKLAGENNVELKTELPAGHARCVFDRASLNLALCHLLENAIMYSHENAGTVAVRLRQAGGKMLLSVSDRGIGVSAEDADRIFQEFFRARNAVERTRFGTGLGLSIAKRAAENLGGTLSFSSNGGDGSVFVLEWPCQTAV